MSEDDFYFLLSISQWGWNLGYIEWYFANSESMKGPFKDDKTNLLYEDIKEAANFAESLKLYQIAAILTCVQSAMLNGRQSGAHLQEQVDALRKISNKYSPLDQ